MSGSEPGLIAVTPGGQVVLGDVRRFVALMDEAGALDAAPMLTLPGPGAAPAPCPACARRAGRRWRRWTTAAPPAARAEEYPAGMLPMEGIGGLPRSSTGDIPAPVPRGRVPIDPEPSP